MSVVTRIRLSQELTVPFTPEEVWRVLADVGAYPDWWPAALRVELVHNPSDLLGAEFEVRPLLGSMFRIRVEELEGAVSMRLRFFGSLEGPGGFHLLALDGATQVRYEMDVFARGLDVAVLSVVLPLERIHRSRMRAVLQSLFGRLAALRVTEEKARRRVEEDEGARRAAEAAEKRRAEEEAATRAAAEEEERRALEEAALRRAVEEAARKRLQEEDSAREANEARQRQAAEEENRRRAVEEAKQRAEEESARRDAEEAERRRAEEEDSAREANEARQRQAAEDENRRRAAEEALRRAEEESARRDAEEAERRRVEEEESLREANEAKLSTGSRLRPFWGRIVNRLREPPAAAAPSPPENDSVDRPLAEPRGSNFDIAREYLKSLSSGATAEEIGRFLSPDITHEEFPHRFLRAPVRRGFGGILEARSSALARFQSQRYELTGAFGGGSQVAMEVRWKGSVATTGAGFTAGQELDARIAFFLKFADGKITRERTYACFEPWSTRAERLLILDERVAQAGQSTQAPPHAPGRAPMEPGGSNFEIARRYLDALSARADAGTIARFYAADAVQDEFPNPFLPGGAHRDLQAIKLSRTRGLALMASESYELAGATGGGSQVALEVAWSGVVGDGLGLFTVGRRLEARLAVFLKFRDGLIVAQSNYSCAPPEA